MRNMLQYKLGKFKAQIQKILSFIKKYLFLCFFEMSAFGVELMTVSLLQVLSHKLQEQ